LYHARASDQIDAAAYAVLEAEEWWGPVKVECLGEDSVA
jgi:hypothetical protein